MRSFAEIFAIAAGRKGGAEALEARLKELPQPKSPTELAAIPEDRWLAAFARAIFNAGFNWKVIEAKWDGFEEAFRGFDVDACAMMDDSWFDALLADGRIVRNGAKVAAVRDNAVFLRGLRERGGAGQVLGGWPAGDYAGLLDLLASEGARLGGTTGQHALRALGVDGFVLSPDVTARLVAEGVIDGPATSKKARAAVQAAFDAWRRDSGRSLTAISRILALSI